MRKKYLKLFRSIIWSYPILSVIYLFISNSSCALNRTSAAKPGDELLATFREQFPHLSSTGEPSASSAVAVANIAAPAHPGALVAPQDRQVWVSVSSLSVTPNPLVLHYPRAPGRVEWVRLYSSRSPGSTNYGFGSHRPDLVHFGTSAAPRARGTSLRAFGSVMLQRSRRLP